ncbi:hypothetical protein DL96DRAFT_1524736 [Flagelloscypha sp. PMI_526]|nr:hypothetical protein DL96DRAFT_1524736 [Flagelloscypha sp. PMI_526]
MSSVLKVPISSLPSPEALITQHLTPDPHTPNLASFRQDVQVKRPSLQRRARLLSSEAHYSYVSPMPLPFPYAIPGPEDPDESSDGGEYIENWLGDREAVEERPGNSSMRINYPKMDDNPDRRLIGLSETCLRDCLPQLDVGDAFTILGEPSLSKAGEDGPPSSSSGAVNVRNELIDVLSGHGVLMPARDSSLEGGILPFAYRYSGHQFGDWAGQLGDGRAISILVAQHPEKSESYELQLKGAGRTPFSRSADGLAVVRSSIREYLCSEAMYALGIPTTRSLSIAYLPDVAVNRETREQAAIVTRVAESFIRIGSFEALNPPTQMFFFGGGQQKANYEAMRILGEWVAKHVLKVVEPGSDEAWGKKLVLETARRNARMVAGWQAYGFMHGVINTDNVSIMGLTIDYGPYAFMDKFDRNHICNHSDSGGRYSYKLQPSMIQFAARALLTALAPVIGKEEELGGKAISKDWASSSEDKIDEWTKKGLEVKDELDRIVQETCSVEYGRLMRKRLGLKREEPTDETVFFRPFLDLLEDYELDFHSSFRHLCSFTPDIMSDEQKVSAFIQWLLGASMPAERANISGATAALKSWLATYAERVESEGREGIWEGQDRRTAMKAANPRFVLRQWVLQETIEKVEKDADVGKRFLAKVMHMACNPFEAWGGEDSWDQQEPKEIEAELQEEARLCGLGSVSMLGFQCSCSS